MKTEADAIKEAVERLNKAIESDKDLRVGLMLDLKENSIPNNCVYVVTATVEIIATIEKT